MADIPANPTFQEIITGARTAARERNIARRAVQQANQDLKTAKAAQETAKAAEATAELDIQQWMGALTRKLTAE